jgi:fermentation-respiration switch protein FrsA (DUF1100 family)
MRWMALGFIVLVIALAAVVRINERRFIYFPLRDLTATPVALGLAFDDLSLITPDGIALHGWFVPARQPVAPVVLFLHGNGGNISHRLDKLRILHEIGASVCIIDYRGYGRSQGTPDETGLFVDAQTAYDWLRERPDAQRVIAYGESLGTAVATDLANHREVGAVILEEGFTSARDVGRELYRFPPLWLLMRSRFDTIGKIARVRVPVLLLHSRDDELFGMHHAQRLLAAAVGPKRLVELRGGHNDAFLVSEKVYRQEIAEFLESIR